MKYKLVYTRMGVGRFWRSRLGKEAIHFTSLYYCAM